MVNTRAVGFWGIGTVLLFFGILILGNIEPEALGATTTSLWLSYIIGFVLVLLGGMFWISSSVISAEED